MLNEFFVNKVESLFKEFQSKYLLTLSQEKSKVRYYSKNINFTVFFERSFEIYVIFETINGQHVDLRDLISYINKERGGHIVISGNQISCESDINYVLMQLFDVMRIVLNMMSEDDSLLFHAFSYLQHVNVKNYKEYIIDQLSHKLKEKWLNKDYFGFLEIYEKNKQMYSFIETYLSGTQKKQIEYAKKKSKESINS